MRELVLTFEDFVNENTEAEDFAEMERVGLLDKAHLTQLLVLNGTINSSNTAIVSNDLLRDSDVISFDVIFNDTVHKVRLDSIMSGPLQNGDQLVFGLGEAVGAKYVISKKYPNVGFNIVLGKNPYDGVEIDPKSNRRLYNLIKTRFAKQLAMLPSSQQMKTAVMENERSELFDLFDSGMLDSKELVKAMMELGEVTDSNAGYVYVVYGNTSVPHRFELTVAPKKIETVYYLDMEPEEQKESVEKMCLDIAQKFGFKYAIMLKNVGHPNFTVILNKDMHVELTPKEFIDIHQEAIKKAEVNA